MCSLCALSKKSFMFWDGKMSPSPQLLSVTLTTACEQHRWIDEMSNVDRLNEMITLSLENRRIYFDLPVPMLGYYNYSLVETCSSNSTITICFDICRYIICVDHSL